MDYDTVHTMALLEAQREYMDMNDEDAEFDIDEEMTETETEAEAEVQCEPQATASTQAAKPQRAIEDLFDENEDVGKKASNYGVESSASKD
ncbi:hypothetical protein Bca4012_045537 [Brassica carinata]